MHVHAAVIMYDCTRQAHTCIHMHVHTVIMYDCMRQTHTCIVGQAHACTHAAVIMYV